MQWVSLRSLWASYGLVCLWIPIGFAMNFNKILAQSLDGWLHGLIGVIMDFILFSIGFIDFNFPWISQGVSMFSIGSWISIFSIGVHRVPYGFQWFSQHMVFKMFRMDFICFAINRFCICFNMFPFWCQEVLTAMDSLWTPKFFAIEIMDFNRFCELLSIGIMDPIVVLWFQ